MINRRGFVGVIAGGGLVQPFAARAQPARKPWRIGVIGIAPLGRSPESTRLLAVFLQALGEHGFIHGQNVLLEGRATEGQSDQAPALAAELVSLHVDVIVALNDVAAVAAKAATATIPIVTLGVSDPVASGLAISLARPGGNVTGLSDLSEDLGTKRLELIKAALPRAVRVALVQDDELKLYGAAKGDAVRRRLDAAAKALGISLVRIVMESSRDFPNVAAAIVRERVDAILGSADAIYSVRKEFAEFAIQQRLPSLVGNRAVMTGGALMSYGADYSDIFRKAATYVAKILNGAKPADLPFEQPTKVELVVNLKAAKLMGVTIPQSVLLRADEVIE